MKNIGLIGLMLVAGASVASAKDYNSTSPHKIPGDGGYNGGTQANGVNAYITGAGGNPWGFTDPQDGMNACFGNGGWDQYAFESVNPATLFNNQRQFVYMEGGDFESDVMEGFLNTNAALIDGWVSGGGRLLINAAPNVGDGMAYPGNIQLHYQELDQSSFAADPNHVVYQGPFTPVQANMTGNYFSHAYVTGGGLSSITNNSFGHMVVAEEDHGSGHIVAGGFTLPGWWSPQPQGYNLYDNIIYYSARVPAPGTGVMLGFGLLAAGRRRR